MLRGRRSMALCMSRDGMCIDRSGFQAFRHGPYKVLLACMICSIRRKAGRGGCHHGIVVINCRHKFHVKPAKRGRIFFFFFFSRYWQRDRCRSLLGLVSCLFLLQLHPAPLISLT